MRIESSRKIRNGIGRNFDRCLDRCGRGLLLAGCLFLLMASAGVAEEQTPLCVAGASDAAGMALSLPGWGDFTWIHPTGRLITGEDGTVRVRGELQGRALPDARWTLELAWPASAAGAIRGTLQGHGAFQGMQLELQTSGDGLALDLGQARLAGFMQYEAFGLAAKSAARPLQGSARLTLDLIECEPKVAAGPRCDRRLAYGIHDEGLADSQIFQIDLDTAEVELIGPLHEGLDLEGLEVNPIDGRIFTLASSLGFLYELDRDTGDLTKVAEVWARKFREIAGLSFRADGVLWGFQKNIGLITIDTSTGATTLQWRAPVNDPVITARWDAIAWSPDSLTLYGSERSRLYRYDAATRTAELICGEDFLPDKTEALDFDLEGKLVGGWHNEAADSLRIFEIDPVACTIESTDYVTPFNDVESLGFEEFCNQPDCSAPIMYGVQDTGLNDSQIFTLDLATGTVETLGPTYSDLDLESIALDPFTGELYATASTEGSFYRVNRYTGDLTRIGHTGARKFREIAAMSFHHDGTLWAFKKNVGLMTIDLATGAATRRWYAPLNDPELTRKWDAIAWDPSGTGIFGAERSRLYRWDAVTRTAELVCGPDFLPDKTEGLEFDLEGHLTGGWHDESENALRIFRIDPVACTLVETVELPFNDIESMDFSYPVGCPIGGGARVVMYGVQDNAFDDSQLFAMNLETGQAQTLGPLYPGLDLESLALDPSTGRLYAAASLTGEFFEVNTTTGTLTLIGTMPARKFREIASLSFHPDGSLWAFQKNIGLITIDPSTALVNREWNAPRDQPGITRKWDAIAWNPSGTELFGAERSSLFRFDPSTQTVELVCGPDFLPDKTEALEFDLQGKLTGGWHDETVDRLSIFSIDPVACTLTETYELPFNDIESLAFEVR